MKNKMTLGILIVLIGILFSTQTFSQILRDQFQKRRQGRVTNQAVLFVQGDMFLLSDRSQIDVRIVLKDNNMYGQPVRSASVTINGVNIPETYEPGVYRGFVGVYIQPYRGCPINTRIVTPDRREVTSSGNLDSLLHLHVSNRFPRQPEKIDVGETPITIRWEFVPRVMKTVDVVVFNMNTNGVLFSQRIGHTDRVIVPRGVIPARQNIEIYVQTPSVSFPISQNVSSDSFIRLHIKTALRLMTFG